eukprot:CAMPEP_0115835280 /NCGR_PEP_ID=MMETSP0287-20121206/4114_1 /TAXON_ID=412157 /ORGANISM="Chrysochromulina rotalis, Strain UIO044" /LENGTH=133 /DNA_ID=CAMNT_0003288735 /DNA_START=33 /DNA_END=434 /DNA_ORIENTATION=-
MAGRFQRSTAKGCWPQDGPPRVRALRKGRAARARGDFESPIQMAGQAGLVRHFSYRRWGLGTYFAAWRIDFNSDTSRRSFRNTVRASSAMGGGGEECACASHATDARELLCYMVKWSMVHAASSACRVRIRDM